MMKRISTFILALLLACTTVLSLFPAAKDNVLGDKKLLEELKAIDYLKTVYASPEEKLATMTKVVENDGYALYIQEYTAEVCIVDKVTGQMLFTNPYDVADTAASKSVKYELMSQIKLSYTGNAGQNDSLNSCLDAALEQQINIKLIRGGVRVEYTLGEAAKKRIIPYQIEKARFEEMILKPFFEATTTSGASFEEYIALKHSSDTMDQAKAEQMEAFDFGRFFAFYSLLDLSDPKLTPREQTTILTAYPITETYAIYILDEETKSAELNVLEGYLREHTKYSLEDMLSDHDMVQYEMEDTSPPIFKMALEYTLEEDGFQVRLPARGITFDASTYTLETIQVLPYLGAGRTAKTDAAIRDDEGYNFIPDGSGAIISFDQNSTYTQVSGTMYGSDFGFYNSTSATTASYQTWRAPVYGTVMTSHQKIYEPVLDEKGEQAVDEEGNKLRTLIEERDVKQGYVAFITEGESLTRIDAMDGGVSHDYHSIGTTFFARQTDSYPLDGITVSGGAAVYTKAIERKYVGNYTIKYRMLVDDKANYVGMAEAYRDFLVKDGILTKQEEYGENINLYLDLIGDIDTTKKFLGMPVRAKAELTTFENAKTIISELKEAGVASQVIRYLGWANGGLAATAPAKLKVEKALGGEKALKDLISYVQSENFQMYMDLNFSYVNAIDMFDGFDEEVDTAKTIDGKGAYYQTYNPIVQAFNTQVAYVISAGSIENFYGKIADKYKSLFGEGTKNISVGSLGNALNSSQDEVLPLNREDAKDYTMGALAKIDEDFDSVLVENGNYYTWKYADTVLNIPLDSSSRTSTTAEVPFLGIVLHGYMNYTGEPINLSGDYEYTLLKTIETGANPYFVVAYDNIAELKNNGYSEYYAVEYATWKDAIVEEYKKLNEVLAPIQGARIVEHEILDNRVVKVSYEGGTQVYLNYNNFAITVEGQELSAMGFSVVNA
ncbi:MAG: hypothetical protein IKJ74_02885 [Clostridia bacterium]|nr:hypothetical protein [Clostridia bacterium]